MTRALWAVLLLMSIAGCDDILPVKTANLCRGDNPVSTECSQCATPPYAPGCPQCDGANKDPDCEGASEAGRGNEAGDGDSGKSGSSANAGTQGGSGEGGMNGNDGGVGGMSGGGAGSGAGTGGNGGSGSSGEGGTNGNDGGAGTGSPACTEDSECGDATPECDDGECVACSGDETCEARAAGTQCDTRDDSTTAGRCVECLGHEDCDDPQAPQCNTEGACVPCTSNDACSDRAGKTLCDARPLSPVRGQCVQCVSSADCENPNPQCITYECKPCVSDSACTDRPGTTVCNTLDNAETEGECVECTGEREDLCGDYSCIQTTGVCTETERGSVGPCEACEADSECDSIARCVSQRFDNQPVGAYCFYIDDATHDCADQDSARKPYSESTLATSIDGDELDYCMPVTTCAAVRDATLQTDCMTNATPDNAKCGEPLIDDGICLAGGECSFPCDNHYDCLVSGFSMCSNIPGGFCE